MLARRALLVLAVLLGFLALAATVSQAPRRATSSRTPPPLPPAGVRPPDIVRLESPGPPRTVRLTAGTASTLEVKVPQAGEVGIQELGLLAPADAATPATFPLRIGRPGRYPVVFAPASGQPRRLGTLVVER